MTALSARFYARATADVARSLLGHVLISEIGRRVVAGRIVETEAYVGPHDPACHAWRGHRSPRNEALYGPPGTSYVYFTYGMHWCLNAVTEREGFPAAVLIRALEPLAGIPTMRRRRGDVADTALCAGPARLCEALGITGALNGVPLTMGRLRIERDRGAGSLPVATTTRIGIRQAADWPLRFVVAGSPWASRRAGPDARPPVRGGPNGRAGRWRERGVQLPGRPSRERPKE